jgi:hypothetical protein
MVSKALIMYEIRINNSLSNWIEKTSGASLIEAA